MLLLSFNFIFFENIDLHISCIDTFVYKYAINHFYSENLLCSYMDSLQIDIVFTIKPKQLWSLWRKIYVNIIHLALSACFICLNQLISKFLVSASSLFFFSIPTLHINTLFDYTTQRSGDLEWDYLDLATKKPHSTRNHMLRLESNIFEYKTHIQPTE